MFVIEHPDVATCVVHVIKDLPDLDPFFDKCLSTIFSYRRWPVSLKEVDLAERIFYASTASKRAVRRVAYGKIATTLERNPNNDIPDSVQQVAELIKDRYALFIHALKSGDLSVHGVSGKSGLPMDIPRGEW